MCSLVCHVGASADAGHYVAYALRRDQWWLCDDRVVRLATATEQAQFARAGEADKVHMAFYQRAPAAHPVEAVAAPPVSSFHKPALMEESDEDPPGLGGSLGCEA